MGAGVRALLRIVHGGVYAHLGERVGWRSGQRLADREVDRTSAADNAARAGLKSAGIVDDAVGADGTGALAVEEIAGVDAVEEKAIRRIALAVGPDGLIAEAVGGARTTEQFGVDAGG